MPTLYPHSIEQKLGFDSIRRDLSDRCVSSMGKEHAASMEFSSDHTSVLQKLNRVWEMKNALESGEMLPDVAFNELGNWLIPLKVVGAYSTSENFRALRNSLKSFEEVRTFYCKRESESEGGELRYPYLSQLFNNLTLYPGLITSIERIIDKTGYVKDSASPELAETRQRLSSLQGSISRTIQRVLSKVVKEGLADKDASPTMRDGRIVIPLPAANKRSISGIIHDESATGKTVFIEPAETVELSNRIRELELEEQRIIVKILTSLSDEIRPFIDEILKNNLLLGKLDFIQAKARYAREIGGELPHLSKQPEIDWYGALHPTLAVNLKNQGKEVVKLNLRLENRKRFLLISGPNAGGKSVALKTIGVVQYMCQCGVLPTLYSNSHVGLFNKLFIDIGDEQSIENDLSTYSSHLKNMRYFLLHSDKRTLVLIDEIGSGTEPNIGSSLAQAILEELAQSRCFGIVTTHYHNLKRFAEENPVFINGAMLYDRQRLQPTFQLSIGNAGSSFALEIAAKIGLPKKVIDAAKQDVGENYVETDKFLMEIARDKKYWQAKRTSIKERESSLEALERKYDALISEINQKRKEIIKEAQKEAQELLQGANKKIENTISEIRRVEAEREKTKTLRSELKEFREEVENRDVESPALKNKLKKDRATTKKKNSSHLQNEISKTPIPKPSKTIEIGSYVKMEGNNNIGKILSLSGKEAEVAFGQLRTMVKLSKLTPASAPKETVNTGFKVVNGNGTDASRQRQLEFRDEIDIRGMRADEALDRLIRFIDDAQQFNIRKVRVLHGTGSGILRQIVRQQLSATPGVRNYDDEDVRLGGAGITVVTLG